MPPGLQAGGSPASRSNPLRQNIFNLVHFLIVLLSFFREGWVSCECVSGVGSNVAVAVTGRTGHAACWYATIRDHLSECMLRLCGLGIIDEYRGGVADLALFGPS